MTMIWWENDDWGMEDGPVLAVCGLAGALIGYGAVETWPAALLGLGTGLAVPLLLTFGLLLKHQLWDEDQPPKEGGTP